eukprot:gene15495-18403_t
MRYTLLFVVIALLGASVLVATTNAIIPPEGTEKPTIHIIAHSHCDAGWLRTFEGYYASNVRHIVPTVIRSLRDYPQRKFIWSDMAFLEMWWRVTASESERQELIKLIKSKRLELVNGGWVMSDEACTTAEAFINQMSDGHKFIKDTFGEEFIPRNGWQIDPFGHATKTGALEAFMGYENIILDRISDLEKTKLGDARDLEFIWRGSKSNGESSDIFAHVLDDYYWLPSGLSRTMDASSPTVWGNAFHNIIANRARHYHSPHFLMTIGGDFMYQNDYPFQKVDATIDHVNLNPEMYDYNIKYSTLAEYFNETREWFAKTQTPLKYYDQDFMPYNEDIFPKHIEWTGYYTSKPYLKGLSRRTDASVRMAEVLEALQHQRMEDPLVSASR